MSGIQTSADNIPFFNDDGDVRLTPTYTRLLRDRIANGMVRQSTGLRDITALLQAPATLIATGHACYIWREGALVTLYIAAKWARELAGDTILTVPDGFRPAWSFYAPAPYGATQSRLIISANGAVQGYAPISGGERFLMTYPTKQAWPSALPGSAA